ncbi:hypothetical protein IU474_29465 [Nocardia otitidiscaviarum]|uniref:hypothetical protein n=1 Tax=Nocardia otitidiscaviarum TaxID=1823 RepID=UPI001895B8AD|nr:hypothetical protein [Nocardia otitidiscaviarum]MBF6241180.1 hypothetical protein [Nocardia otitidiscaviarum]
MKAVTAAGIAAATAAAALAAGSRIPVVRDAVLHWGATAAEVERALPGDDLAPRADVVATRAIRIAAPPAVVWPWLVQMGPGRVGRTPTTGSRTCSGWICTARTGFCRSSRRSPSAR